MRRIVELRRDRIIAEACKRLATQRIILKMRKQIAMKKYFCKLLQNATHRNDNMRHVLVDFGAREDRVNAGLWRICDRVAIVIPIF